MISKFLNTSKIVGSRLMTLALLVGPSLAMAQQTGGGLSRAKTGIDNFNTAFLTLVGSAAIAAGLFAAVGYKLGWMDLSGVTKIGIGLLICASITGAVGLLFPQ